MLAFTITSQLINIKQKRRKMLFQQELYLLWSSLELFMALTHLFVFLGFRNSKLGFLRRQQNYFLLDAFTHLINIFINSQRSIGYSLNLLWIYAFIVHLYYYQNLKTNPLPKQKQDDNSDKISRIFHWSCIEYQANRFSISDSGRQMLETSLDVLAHTCGFLLAFQQIHSMIYRFISILLMLGLFNRQMLSLKYFLTEPKMMPVQLQRFFSNHK